MLSTDVSQLVHLPISGSRPLASQHRPRERCQRRYLVSSVLEANSSKKLEKSSAGRSAELLGCRLTLCRLIPYGQREGLEPDRLWVQPGHRPSPTNWPSQLANRTIRMQLAGCPS